MATCGLFPCYYTIGLKKNQVELFYPSGLGPRSDNLENNGKDEFLQAKWMIVFILTVILADTADKRAAAHKRMDFIFCNDVERKVKDGLYTNNMGGDAHFIPL